MFDIKELERKWLIYKIKSYLPHIITVTILVASIFILNHIWSDTPKKSIPKAIVAKKQPISKPTNIPADNEDTIIEPSMDFISDINIIDLPQNTQAITNNTVNKQITNSVITPQKLNLPQLESPPYIDNMPQEPQKKEQKLGSLAIKKSDNKVDIASLEERFKENANANLGLYIARYHYDNGNFSEAYNYSLKTNAINSKLDESWLLFCKSLIKLGRKDQARKTLMLYIKESQSESAISLLDSIDKGTFK